MCHNVRYDSFYHHFTDLNTTTVCGDFEARRDHAAHVEPRPNLGDDSLVDHRHVQVALRHQDPQLAPGFDSVPPPHRRQRRDLSLQVPVEQVIVKLQVIVSVDFCRASSNDAIKNDRTATGRTEKLQWKRSERQNHAVGAAGA